MSSFYCLPEQVQQAPGPGRWGRPGCVSLGGGGGIGLACLAEGHTEPVLSRAIQPHFSVRLLLRDLKTTSKE